MIQAVLFDLDGTLLPLDTDHFIHEYFGAITAYVAEAGLMAPDLFMKRLMAGTQAMLENVDQGLTNQEAFSRAFFSGLALDPGRAWPLFNEFYREVFPTLKERVGLTAPTGLSRKVAEAAAAGGRRQIVMATNPLFPREAIIERLRWAGVAELPWALITSYELMHAAKPRLQYYEEIVSLLDIPPERCLMVGNDVDDDLVASSLGMKTFLVTDHLINRRGAPVEDHPQGSLKELLDYLNNL